ncbi:nucleoside diphosphate kinase [Coelomomyces lativittatus]|nr:nucleoside diphosphate kinase [Coelomomyces lativittatus]
MARERTFIMVKPDVGDILSRFEHRGYKLIALKMMQPSRAHFEEHYKDLKTKPFFPSMIDAMCTGPVVAMVFEGKSVVKVGRMMLGATNPLESVPGTIRGDYAIDVGKNICHGSDSVESAEREISHWFPEGVMKYEKMMDKLIYE